MSFDVATFRADSVRLFGVIEFGGWTHYDLRGDTLFRDQRDEAYLLEFRGDTLMATPISEPERGTTLISKLEWSTSLMPLHANPDAPVPDRIAISLGGCFGPCPHSDVEFDRSGTVYLRSYGEDGPLATQQATGAGETFARLSRLAANLRAGTTHYIDSVFDDQEVALVLGYGDTTRVHTGSVHGFGRLRLLLAEARDAVPRLRFLRLPPRASSRVEPVLRSSR